MNPLRPQIAILNTKTDQRLRDAASSPVGNRSQFAAASQRPRDLRYLPYAFAELGALMTPPATSKREIGFHNAKK